MNTIFNNYLSVYIGKGDQNSQKFCPRGLYTPPEGGKGCVLLFCLIVSEAEKGISSTTVHHTANYRYSILARKFSKSIRDLLKVVSFTV